MDNVAVAGKTRAYAICGNPSRAASAAAPRHRSTSTPSSGASAPRSRLAGEPIPSLTCRASSPRADLGLHPQTIGASARPRSTCANFNTPSTAPLRIHGLAGPATRSASAIASSPPGHTRCFIESPPKASSTSCASCTNAWTSTATSRPAPAAKSTARHRSPPSIVQATHDCAAMKPMNNRHYPPVRAPRISSNQSFRRPLPADRSVHPILPRLCGMNRALIRPTRRLGRPVEGRTHACRAR